MTSDKAGDLTLVSVPLAGDPTGDAAQAMIKHVRTSDVPQAFAGVPARVYVTGNAAGVVDYLAFFNHWLPIAIVLVLGLSFVLLLVAFRSLVIPAQGDHHEPALA